MCSKAYGILSQDNQTIQILGEIVEFQSADRFFVSVLIPRWDLHPRWKEGLYI